MNASVSRFVARFRKPAIPLCWIAILLPMAVPAWGALPPGWSDMDIGSPGLAGSASYTNDLWTVTGGGSDIWDTADQFNFA